MKRGRKTKRLEWLWSDPGFVAIHGNNLLVFRKISRMRAGSSKPSAARAIDALFGDPDWRERMGRMTRRSWKAAYFRWLGG